jgi:cytochrome c biogenesis protein
MAKAKNTVWRFFASVQLALTILIILAGSSIIGTLIQQGQASSFYIKKYGPNLARFFWMLDFTDMYHSWWFIALLTLFAINLVVCSIERLPGAWRLVVMDNLALDPERLEKMRFTHRAEINLTSGAAGEQMSRLLNRAGWGNPDRRDRENGSILLFAQKGVWTRFGVYLVHLSILIILAGAIIGTFFGFKAYVFLPEGRTTQNVFLQESKKQIPLGFELHCDRFAKVFYPNGMIKKYRTDLTVFDPKRDNPYHKSIIVNDPLTYRGITFYLADSYPLNEFMMVLRNRTTGMEQAFRVPLDKNVSWQGANISFRIEECRRAQGGAVQQAEIRFDAAGAAPAVFWMDDQSTATIGGFTLSIRQLYSTLLLAIKDPGILIVYFGSCLMIIGLAISFFLSHQRIWAYLTPREDQGMRILISGISNKNKPAFNRRFQELIDLLKQDVELSS